ncbi:glycosyltransferase [Chryseobacterium sp. TY3]
MKITIIIADITRTGGTERATVNLANILAKDHQLTILSLGRSGASFFKLESAITLHFLNIGDIPVALKGKVFWYYKFYKRTINYFKKHSADTIIGQGHNINVFLPFFRRGNTKVFACEHIDYDTIPGVSKKLMKFCYPQLNGLVVLSEIAKNKLKKFNKNIYIIPNSLPFETEQTSSQNNRNLIMVGRISKEKGYERIIPIAKNLSIDFPDWRIDIYGDGEMKIDLLQLIKNHNIHNVFLHNPVDNIMNKYIESSILLMTSYSEAMPMVILEANHCGLPIVAFRNEGTETLIDNTGYIADNSDEFYKNLKILIENKILRNTLSRNARNYAEQYRKRHIEDKWKILLL